MEIGQLKDNIMGSALGIIDNKIEYNKLVYKQFEAKNKNLGSTKILKHENEELKNAVKVIKRKMGCW